MAESGGELACKLGIASICGAVIAVMVGAPRWSFDEKSAAWVQAIGSLIGIVIAIAVPYVQQRNAAKVRSEDMARIATESDDRARTMAIGLNAGFSELRWRCEILLRHWPEGRPASHMLPHPQEQRNEPSEIELFEMPAELAGAKTVLHELRAAAHSAQRAFYHAEKAEHFITALLSEGEPYWDDDIRPEIVKCLDACDSTLAEFDRLLR